jgi:hypothetical protein
MVAGAEPGQVRDVDAELGRERVGHLGERFRGEPEAVDEHDDRPLRVADDERPHAQAADGVPAMGELRSHQAAPPTVAGVAAANTGLASSPVRSRRSARKPRTWSSVSGWSGSGKRSPTSTMARW